MSPVLSMVVILTGIGYGRVFPLEQDWTGSPSDIPELALITWPFHRQLRQMKWYLKKLEDEPLFWVGCVIRFDKTIQALSTFLHSDMSLTEDCSTMVIKEDIKPFKVAVFYVIKYASVRC
jgi:hypothetical protein